MIGVFDSGYGGLTILKELIKSLPSYDYMYLGDNARTPYGNRGKSQITKFTKQGIDFLFKKGCSLIIIACFTASSEALRDIQVEYLRKPGITDKKILGVIRPVIEKAVLVSPRGRIGVTGTRGTISSNAFEIECKKLRSDVKICSQACPLLVPLIEEHWYKKPEARMILKKYLRKLKTCNLDTLILGCTHYGVMMKDFERIMGKRCNVLNSGEIVAESLKDYLKRHSEIDKLLSKKKEGTGKQSFYTTDSKEKFGEFTRMFFGQEMKNIEQVSIE